MHFSGEADFNTSAISVVFPADEGGLINDVRLSFPIVDDAIKEHSEQMFVISTTVSEAINFDLVNNTGRNVSTMRILDDDSEYQWVCVCVCVLALGGGGGGVKLQTRASTVVQTLVLLNINIFNQRLCWS